MKRKIKNQLHDGALYAITGIAGIAPFVSHYFAGWENFCITVLVTVAAGAWIGLFASVNE